MVRPVFTPVYEESESVIKDRIINRIPDGWRKEPGDFIHDAVAAVPLEVKQLQVNQDTVLKNGFAQYAEGDKLDLRLAEVGMTRGQATPNKRSLNVTADAGVVIPAGQIASVVVLDAGGNPLEYTVVAQVSFAATGTQSVAITCTTAGAIGNVPNGSQFIFMPPIPGVSLLVDTGSDTMGTDAETDETAYDRYMFKVQNPDTGGNKNDYVRWAQSVAGVGKAKCVPRWNGNGTVKVVLVGPDFAPATAGTVNNVQNYLDPGITGLGDGKAPCGAALTVIAATDVPINIMANITWVGGANQAAALQAFKDAVTSYLVTLVFSATPTVVYNKIASLLVNTEGVSNYAALQVNGSSADVVVGAEAVATLGTVTFS